MKISCCTKPFYEHNLEFALKRIHNVGYDGADITNPSIGPGMKKEIKMVTDFLKGKEFEISSVFSGAHALYKSSICSSSIEERQVGIKITKDTIDYAAALNCKYVLIMGYYQWPYVQMDPDKYWNWTKESLIICADYAGKKGITLILEIEPTIAYVINSPWAAKKMVEEIGSDFLRINADIGHLNLMTYKSGTICDFLDIMQEYIVSFHICDNDGITDLEAPPGTGNINWPVVIRKIYDINFSGYLGVELIGGFNQRDADGGIYQGIEFLKKYIKT